MCSIVYGNKFEKRKEGAGNEDQIRREKDLINTWRSGRIKRFLPGAGVLGGVPPHAKLQVVPLC
jgi:hypothetical protein